MGRAASSRVFAGAAGPEARVRLNGCGRPKTPERTSTVAKPSEYLRTSGHRPEPRMYRLGPQPDGPGGPWLEGGAVWTGTPTLPLRIPSASAQQYATCKYEDCFVRYKVPWDPEDTWDSEKKWSKTEVCLGPCLRRGARAPQSWEPL